MKYNSIFQNEFESDYCFRCSRYGATDWHHIFNAAYKKKSEQYGAMIRVCRECHEIIHTKEMQRFKELGQRKVMKHHGMTIEDFRKAFGTNYLQDEICERFKQ